MTPSLDVVPAPMNGQAANPAPAVTLATLLQTMAARVNRLNDAAVAPVAIRAIPIKPPPSRKNYNALVYCGLQDPFSRDAIDALLPERLVESVPWGVEATVVGVLAYRVFQGQVRPEFRIDSAAAVSGGSRQRSRAELEKRWQESIRRPKRKLAAAFAVERPRVVLVTGITSVAADDVA
jgi:hypothetical protein